jgi:hypothetical protein
LRYSAQILRQLTNVDLPEATTINDTVGTQAATDASFWFERVVQSVYDNTNSRHLIIGTRATYHLLREWSGRFSDVIQAERESIEEEMRLYRTHGAGKRITPVTTSTLTPTNKELIGDPSRPYFDNDRFDRLTPDPPPAST